MKSKWVIVGAHEMFQLREQIKKPPPNTLNPIVIIATTLEII